MSFKRSLAVLICLVAIGGTTACDNGRVVEGKCGNEEIDSGEECDWGATTIADCFYGETACSVCNDSCEFVAGVVSFCGDGAVDLAAGEQCDWAVNATEDCAYGETQCEVCTGTCQFRAGLLHLCGDGTVDDTETCDHGPDPSLDCAYGDDSCTVCTGNCEEVAGVTSICGDGNIDENAGEQCDDNNALTEVCPSGVVSCTVCDAQCHFLTSSLDTVATNVILIIGDGMGPEQIRAGGMYAHGEAGTLSFEAFPYQGMVNTTNIDGAITDSAAAATALATGHKVSNGVLSLAPDGSSYTTILELAAAADMNTGLVTTTSITHATPAAFASHIGDRNEYGAIGVQYFTTTQPDVLLGGAPHVSVSQATEAGYTVVESRQALMDLSFDVGTPVSGQFGEGYMPYEYDGLGNLPHLSDMVTVALGLLEQDNGFFLMIEAGRIDHACHSNDLIRSVYETMELDATVQAVLSWASARRDTLIIVTADHETGGLTITDNNGQGQLPTATWSSTNHTSTPVPVFGWGVGADLVPELVENTHIYDLMFNAAGAPGS